MDELFSLQDQLLENLSSQERYLLNDIDWSNRLIGIKGARGSGKTTLLLQYIKYKLPKDSEYLYTTLDDLYFLDHTLVALAKEFVLRGGTHLMLDEVHKYPNWSRELKLIYDQFPTLHILFTSSSMLEIYKGESDLSRRVIMYHLKELSFREFIQFENHESIPKIELKDLLKNHPNLISIVDNNRNNALHLAAQNGYVETVAKLHQLEQVRQAYGRVLVVQELLDQLQSRAKSQKAQTVLSHAVQYSLQS